MASILIVDDEASISETLQALLQAESHSVVVTRCGKDGLQKMGEVRFDLVITDLMMDPGTGFDVLEWIRKNAPTLPVLICSSYARPELLRPHLSGHQYRILKKPFQTDELMEMVQALLPKAGDRSG